MAGSRNTQKQKVTISLSRNVLKKAKILAARRETSISRLLARELESLVGDEEAYERAEWQALALLDKGFHPSRKSLTDLSCAPIPFGVSTPHLPRLRAHYRPLAADDSALPWGWMVPKSP
jgi:hypothetical protein